MGSSPLARGLPWVATRTSIAAGDHPRSRGVYDGNTTHPPSPAGSSPLARGLPRGSLPDTAPRGIIPARAGFTSTSQRFPGREWDHPRSRGVYGGLAGKDGDRWGSSPLARGLLVVQGGPEVVLGIIPARAGFTYDRAMREQWLRDHPRSRGVYREEAVMIKLSPGSSPLARGLPRTTMPRSTRVIGSSPLARGLPQRAPRGARAMRIIPARAGFTHPSRTRASSLADHPRSRGVYPAPKSVRGRPAGSSPLARGLRWFATIRTRALGIIPARAGFTS